MSDKRYPRICFMCNCEAKYLGRLDRSQGRIDSCYYCSNCKSYQSKRKGMKWINCKKFKGEEVYYK